MKDIKPIKRSPQLQPLSREHHDGLLFVWKVREGLKNKTSTDILRRYTAWFCKNHIVRHFFQEEKILLPFVPATHTLHTRLKEDHDYIRELIHSIHEHADRQDFIRLAAVMEEHIRFEEREFFRYLEDHLSNSQLTEILMLLEKHPVSCSNEWELDFWNGRKESPETREMYHCEVPVRKLGNSEPSGPTIS